jgi:hypothetical protein
MNGKNLIEEIQRMIVRQLAESREGKDLHLIGGFRLRLLDNSPRASMDVDYHSSVDIERKRDGVVALLTKKLLPAVKEKFGHEGTIAPARGPDADSPAIKTIDIAFYIPDFAYSRIEMCVDITTMEVLDKPIPRTTGGVVYLTRSDQDIMEGKVIAVLASAYVRDRDLVDIFLFEEKVRRKLRREDCRQTGETVNGQNNGCRNDPQAA